jgi:GT2 family glycosyltransferase
MIFVWTPVHGKPPIVDDCFRAINENVPEPFVHWIGDDFSSEEDSSEYRAMADGTKRFYYHCRDIGGTASPNLGLSMRYIFGVARAMNPEALLFVESDVIITPGIIDRFRDAVVFWGTSHTGCVTPLYTNVGENRVETYGGLDEFPSMGIPRFSEIGSWSDPDVPRLGRLPWAHTACLWIPNGTLQRPEIDPDPNFALYYVDHDLSRQIRDAGLDILLTSRAVAGHTRGGGGTIVRWPNEQERQGVERDAFQQLREKWSGH